MRAKDERLFRHIGVGNYSVKQIEARSEEMLAYCSANDIIIQTYSPLRTPYGLQATLSVTCHVIRESLADLSRQAKILIVISHDIWNAEPVADARYR